LNFGAANKKSGKPFIWELMHFKIINLKTLNKKEID
jgi:hypothetical protein